MSAEFARAAVAFVGTVAGLKSIIVDGSTTDITAGDGAETVVASECDGDSVTFVNGFRFIEDLVTGDSYRDSGLIR